MQHYNKQLEEEVFFFMMREDKEFLSVEYIVNNTSVESIEECETILNILKNHGLVESEMWDSEKWGVIY